MDKTPSAGQQTFTFGDQVSFFSDGYIHTHGVADPRLIIDIPVDGEWPRLFEQSVFVLEKVDSWAKKADASAANTNDRFATDGGGAATPGIFSSFSNHGPTSPADGGPTDGFDAAGEMAVSEHVLFGCHARIRHVVSGFYVTVNRRAKAEKDPQCASLVLTPPTKTGELLPTTVFRLMPKYKVRHEGERVATGDHVTLHNETSRMYVSMTPDPFGKEGEVNASVTAHAWAINMYKPHRVHKAQSLRTEHQTISAGYPIAFFHKEHELFLSYDAPNRKIVFQPPEEFVSSNSTYTVSKLNFNSNSVWILENVDPRIALDHNPNMAYRLRHLSQNLYLGVSTLTGDLELRELDAPPNPAADTTLWRFCLSSAATEEGLTSDATFLRLFNAYTGSWLQALVGEALKTKEIMTKLFDIASFRPSSHGAGMLADGDGVPLDSTLAHVMSMPRLSRTSGDGHAPVNDSLVSNDSLVVPSDSSGKGSAVYYSQFNFLTTDGPEPSKAVEIDRGGVEAVVSQKYGYSDVLCLARVDPVIHSDINFVCSHRLVLQSYVQQWRNATHCRAVLGAKSLLLNVRASLSKLICFCTMSEISDPLTREGLPLHRHQNFLLDQEIHAVVLTSIFAPFSDLALEDMLVRNVTDVNQFAKNLVSVRDLKKPALAVLSRILLLGFRFLRQVCLDNTRGASSLMPYLPLIHVLAGYGLGTNSLLATIMRNSVQLLSSPNYEVIENTLQLIERDVLSPGYINLLAELCSCRGVPQTRHQSFIMKRVVGLPSLRMSLRVENGRVLICLPYLQAVNPDVIWWNPRYATAVATTFVPLSAFCEKEERSLVDHVVSCLRLYAQLALGVSDRLPWIEDQIPQRAVTGILAGTTIVPPKVLQHVTSISARYYVALERMHFSEGNSAIDRIRNSVVKMWPTIEHMTTPTGSTPTHATGKGDTFQYLSSPTIVPATEFITETKRLATTFLDHVTHKTDPNTVSAFVVLLSHIYLNGFFVEDDVDDLYTKMISLLQMKPLDSSIDVTKWSERSVAYMGTKYHIILLLTLLADHRSDHRLNVLLKTFKKQCVDDDRSVDVLCDTLTSICSTDGAAFEAEDCGADGSGDKDSSKHHAASTHDKMARLRKERNFREKGTLVRVLIELAKYEHRTLASSALQLLYKLLCPAKQVAQMLFPLHLVFCNDNGEATEAIHIAITTVANLRSMETLFRKARKDTLVKTMGVRVLGELEELLHMVSDLHKAGKREILRECQMVMYSMHLHDILPRVSIIFSLYLDKTELSRVAELATEIMYYIAVDNNLTAPATNDHWVELATHFSDSKCFSERICDVVSSGLSEVFKYFEGSVSDSTLEFICSPFLPHATLSSTMLRMMDNLVSRLCDRQAYDALLDALLLFFHGSTIDKACDTLEIERDLMGVVARVALGASATNSSIIAFGEFCTVGRIMAIFNDLCVEGGDLGDRETNGHVLEGKDLPDPTISTMSANSETSSMTQQQAHQPLHMIGGATTLYTETGVLFSYTCTALAFISSVHFRDPEGFYALDDDFWRTLLPRVEATIHHAIEVFTQWKKHLDEFEYGNPSRKSQPMATEHERSCLATFMSTSAIPLLTALCSQRVAQDQTNFVTRVNSAVCQFISVAMGTCEQDPQLQDPAFWFVVNQFCKEANKYQLLSRALDMDDVAAQCVGLSKKFSPIQDGDDAAITASFASRGTSPSLSPKNAKNTDDSDVRGQQTASVLKFYDELKKEMLERFREPSSDELSLLTEVLREELANSSPDDRLTSTLSYSLIQHLRSEGLNEDVMVMLLVAFRIVLEDAAEQSAATQIMMQNKVNLLYATWLISLLLERTTYAVAKSTIDLGIALLDGGNKQCQDSLLTYFFSHDEKFFMTARQVLRRSEIEMSSLQRNVVNRRELNARYGWDVELPSLLQPGETMLNLVERMLRLLQLLCEGHHLAFQNYVRIQHDNLYSYDICASVMELLRNVLYLVDPSSISLAIQAFNSLTEFCQGPCQGNQEAIVKCNVVAECNQVLSSNFTGCDPSHVQQLKQAAVLTLLSLLEGTQSAKTPNLIFETLNLTAIKDLLDFVWANSEDDDMLDLGFNVYILANTLMAEGDKRKADQMLKILQSTKGHTYFSSMMGNLEILRSDSRLETVYFRKPAICLSLRQSTRDELLVSVNRSSQTSKLSDFFRQAENLIFEMEFQHSIQNFASSHSGPMRLLYSCQPYYFEQASLVIAYVSNLLLILGFQTRTGPSSPSVWYVFFLFGLFQIFCFCYTLVTIFVLRTPVIAHQTYTADGNTTTDPFLELSASERLVLMTRWSLIREVLFNTNTLWAVCNVIFAMLGVWVSPFYFCFHLLLILNRFPLLKNIVTAITTNGNQIILTALLATIVVYLFSVIGYLFFQEDFISEDEEGALNCDTLAECFFFSLGKGIRNGGGIGETLKAKKFMTEGYFAREAYDFLFFALVLVILMNIVFALIVDTFAELRDAKQKIEEDMANYCFICGISANEFDRSANQGGETFQRHVKQSHNMWAYLYFLHHLRRKDQSEFTGQESFVWEKMKEGSLAFFPVGRSKSIDAVEALERASAARDAAEANKSSDTSKSLDDDEDLRKQLEDGFSKLKDQINRMALDVPGGAGLSPAASGSFAPMDSLVRHGSIGRMPGTGSMPRGPETGLPYGGDFGGGGMAAGPGGQHHQGGGNANASSGSFGAVGNASIMTPQSQRDLPEAAALRHHLASIRASLEEVSGKLPKKH